MSVMIEYNHRVEGGFEMFAATPTAYSPESIQKHAKLKPWVKSVDFSL